MTSDDQLVESRLGGAVFAACAKRCHMMRELSNAIEHGNRFKQPSQHHLTSGSQITMHVLVLLRRLGRRLFRCRIGLRGCHIVLGLFFGIEHEGSLGVAVDLCYLGILSGQAGV